MKVEKKTRTDNPLTDHSDETESLDVVKVNQGRDDEEKEKVLSVEPPEKDDDEPGEQGPTPRQQRRRARYDEMQQRADDAEKRAQEAEARAHALWAAQQVQSQQQVQPQVDPLDEEEKKIKDDWKNHVALGDTFSKSSTPEQQQKWKDDFLTLQQRMQAVTVKKEMRAAGFQPGQRVNLAEEALKAQLAADYSDIVTNNRHLAYADGLARQRSAQFGRGLSRQEFDDVMNETRRVFRLPTAKSSAPSREMRQKFSGTGLGGASNGTNGAGRGEIRMNEDMMAMAEAKYTHETDKNGKRRRLTKAEAHAKWAQNEGKRVVEKYG
jgi:hypothetical protein